MDRLPALFANNLKINFNFMLDHSQNPLNQSISSNPQAKKKIHGQRKLSERERTNQPPGCQASERLVIPFRL
jgi:hypothetical protein